MCIWFIMFSNIFSQVLHTCNLIFMISKISDYHNFREMACTFQSLFIFPIFTTFMKSTIMIIISASRVHTSGEIDFHDLAFSFPTFTTFVKLYIMIFISSSKFHNSGEIDYHDFHFHFQFSHP